MDQPPREELEFIPWSDLLERRRVARPWIAYLVAGALAAAGTGALVARAVWSPRMTPPPIEVEQAAAPEEEVAGPAPLTPALYREADLMAVAPEVEAARAAMRAEWFVADYFTVDGDAGGAEQVRAVLPTRASLPPLPHERPGPVSYVEWARTVESELLEEGLYRVTVAFRSIAGVDGSFRRLPVRAVAVVVGVDPVGGSAVLDIPIPVSLPPAPDTVPWPAEGAAPPDEVVGEALAEAGSWGSDPQVISAGPVGEAWRVVVEVGDEAGRRWPLVLWLGGSGPLSSPPWLGPGPP